MCWKLIVIGDPQKQQDEWVICYILPYFCIYLLLFYKIFILVGVPQILPVIWNHFLEESFPNTLVLYPSLHWPPSPHSHLNWIFLDKIPQHQLIQMCILLYCYVYAHSFLPNKNVSIVSFQWKAWFEQKCIYTCIFIYIYPGPTTF